MRLQRGTPVAGVALETARNIARACHDHWRTTTAIPDRVRVPAAQLTELLERLTDAGYLQRRDGRHSARAEWNTTITGGALTMASFLKPISRDRAEKLLAGILERADEYNADDAKLYVITELAVFGSYLRRQRGRMRSWSCCYGADQARPRPRRPQRGGAPPGDRPGAFTDPAAFYGASTVLVTHAHPDHSEP